MKNKIEFKKTITYSIVVIVIFNLIFLGFYNYQYRKYTYSFNEKINQIALAIRQKYPDIDKTEIVEILNNKSKNSDYRFKQRLFCFRK